MGGLVGAKPGREVEAKWWNAWNSRPQSLDLILRCHHNQQELLELLEGNKGWGGLCLGNIDLAAVCGVTWRQGG